MFEELNFKDAPKILIEPPGPKAREILELQKRIEGNTVLYPLTLPFVPEEALGATIRDVDGNTYIEMYAGISVLNFGYSNPYILEKAVEQLRKLAHTLDFPSRAREALVERLLSIAPEPIKGDGKVIFGGPTGSDAVEGAVKLAKYYTKRHSIIAFSGSYHGQTTMALALTGSKKYKEPLSPLGPEVYFAPYPDSYRCPFKTEDPGECCELVIAFLENMLENPYSGVPTPAAIIVEPIQGEGGIIVPPDNFLPKLEKLAHKNDVLLIIDEIQSGLGRTGKWFALEHYDVKPDVVTMAKSLGGIGLPLAGVMYRRDLDIWPPGAHVGTFRGNVVAMAAGAAAIDFAIEHNLLDHVNKVGLEALKFLRDLAEESKYIGDVRGKGLMLAVEFVKDKATKEPFKDIAGKIQIEAFKKGVIVWKAGGYGNIIRFLPPLVITEELMMKGLEIFRDAVKSVEELF